MPTLAADDPIARVIERVAAYLDSRPLEHDELWFVQQGSAVLGADFFDWASALAATGPPDGAEKALAATRALRLPEIEALPAAPETPLTNAPPYMASFAASHQLFAQMLVLAATCHASPERAADLRHMIGQRTHGYVLAHQAWAVRIGAAHGCLDPQDAERLRGFMARSLLAELRASDALTDLDVERAAVLCLIGACHWVPEPWLAALLREQQATGGWGDRAGAGVDRGNLREEHTAALAFYLLAARFDAARAVATSARSGTPSIGAGVR